jgi:GWxTD domain-containing protein
MNTALGNALGLALIHFLWEGAVIALLLALFWRAGARMKYAAACVALSAMPVAFGATLFRLWTLSGGAVTVRGIVVGRGIVDLSVLMMGTPPIAPAARWGWLVPVWIAGVAVFYLRSLGGWMVVHRLRRAGTSPVSAEWRERFETLRARARVRRAVALVESCLSEVPVVIGWLRPVVLLPAGMATGLSTEQVEALLLHELAHVRRHDYLVNLLQSAIEGLLFYHPAVWWVSHVIRTEREHCCDDVVVALRGDRRGYAGALAALEALRAPQTAMAATGGSLVARVRRLVGRNEGPQGSPASAIAAVVLILGAALLVGAWQQRPQEAVQNPYQKWLTQDVAYIITNEERAAFRALATDEEREHFIEQFWQRRDPTPGTAANEFKEEHYRRIAYSNENFAAPDGLAGWKTDQGRIYIVYGPPDEKESHPSDNPPFEQWLYRHIDGIGNNVIIEFRLHGRMRMTSDPRVNRGR